MFYLRLSRSDHMIGNRSRSGGCRLDSDSSLFPDQKSVILQIYYSYFFLSFFVFIGYRQRSSVSHLRIAAKVALVFASFCCATQEDRQRERGSWCQWHQRFYKQDATLRFRFIQGWKMLHIPPSCMTCQSTATHWQTNSLFWDFFFSVVLESDLEFLEVPDCLVLPVEKPWGPLNSQRSHQLTFKGTEHFYHWGKKVGYSVTN